jgi:DNA helicase-4
LSKHHIKPQRQNDYEFYRRLLRNPDYRQEVEGFYQLLHSFLLLHKNNLYNFADVEKRLKTDNIYSARRNELFLKIYQRLQCGYEKYLQHTRRFDFADMINHATQCVQEINECARGYKYILLDEVQDLSRNRFLLVQAILRKNPGCKIFAVGDDWQSIYRFAGSDLALIQKFETFFKLKTRRSFIESTHRFGQPTINISCNFIQQNPKQSRKKVHNIQQTKTPIFIVLNRDCRARNGQDADSLQTILQNLITEHGYDTIRGKSLQVIARYNHDIARIKSEHFVIESQDNAQIYNIL